MLGYEIKKIRWKLLAGAMILWKTISGIMKNGPCSKFYMIDIRIFYVNWRKTNKQANKQANTHNKISSPRDYWNYWISPLTELSSQKSGGVLHSSPAPGYFQQIMDQVMQDLPGVAGYLDDLLISGKDAEDHLKNLRQLLQRLHEKGLRCRLEKCPFAEPYVEYLGHLLSH